MKKRMLFFLWMILAVCLAAGCGKGDSAQIGKEPDGQFNTEDEVLEGEPEKETEPGQIGRASCRERVSSPV